jgi:hypothetical protein
MLGREGEGALPLLRGGGRERPLSLREASGRRSGREAQGGAAAEQRVHRHKFAMRERRQHGTVRIGSGVAEQIDQGDLRSAFPRHLARSDEPERRVEGGPIGFRSGIEDGLRDLDDVGRQGPWRIGFSAANSSSAGLWK